MSHIRKSLLDNGTRVITEDMRDVESATVGVWVTTGSRNEHLGENGISHFIEHLFFKGTRKRTALDIAKEIESVGGVLNAFTGREYTCFYAKVIAKDLPLAIDLLSDIFINSLLDSRDIVKERKVVAQEIKMVNDTPDDLVHDLFVEALWKNHPLGRPVLGNIKTIQGIKREKILAYLKRHYHPGNIIICAAGDLKHDRVVDSFARTFGAIKPRGMPDAVTAAHCHKGARIVKRNLEQVHFCLGVPAPPQADEARYKVYLLNTILGGGMSSRLFQEIRERRGLAYSVYSYLNLCIDAGSLVVYAGTTTESFRKVLECLMEEFEKLHDGVSAEELRNAKNQLKGGMILGLETSDNRMTKLARDEIYFKRHIPVREIVRGIDAVTRRDMRDVAGGVLALDKSVLTAIGKVNPSDMPRALKYRPL